MVFALLKRLVSFNCIAIGLFCVLSERCKSLQNYCTTFLSVRRT